MMNEQGKSDRPVVPAKFPNKVQPSWTAEGMEGKGLAEGNLRQQNTLRPPSRESVPSALERVRQAAQGDKKYTFRTLIHLVYDLGRLREAYYNLKREAAPGVDGETWKHYGENLEANLQDLSMRLRRGAYRAKPVKRAYILKEDGRQRPLGVPVLEDKIVQRATVEVLNAVYETDFADFSYGFRPGRNQHQALNVLYVELMTGRVNWVLDADIRAYFDTISHEWLRKFVEHRITDRHVQRLIQKWLSAGVMEEGKRMWSEAGTPQGGCISPLLANVYLHYAFDLWARWWRKKQAQGGVVFVRYADDIIIGFENKADAERFWAEMRERLGKFGLELHPEKARLLEFGPKAEANRRRGGKGKPGTFDFLGFKHICGKSRKGRFLVLRQTIRKRMQAKLSEVKEGLRERLHDSIPAVGRWLSAVVGGHIRYFGVPTNSRAIQRFRIVVARLWRSVLMRRSQRGYVTRARLDRLVRQWLPPARICHPYPVRRLCVST